MQIKNYQNNIRSLEAFQKFLQLCFGISIFILLCVAVSFAQDNVNLSGNVTDSNGAAVAGATVKTVSIATNSERSTTSNADGFYSLQQLKAGMYKVTITNSGFKTAQFNSIELGAGQSRTIDVKLELGDLTAIVDIASGDATLATVDQSSNRLGTNISSREVEELPVNGRNFSQLYLNAPGATNSGSGNFNDLRFNGRSNQQNQTKLDGVEASAIFDASPGYVAVQGSQFRLQTSIENIQEFRVDSSNYPAESGTGTGGQINVIGKSGGNQLKGSAFYYIRNDALDARNFFDGATKSPLRLGQFGGSLGGKIIKDKLFFFGSYEGLRQRAGFNVIESTPSNFVRDFVNLYVGETSIAGNAQGNAARLALGLSPLDPAVAADAIVLARIAALRGTGIINSFTTGTGALFNSGGLLNSGQLIQINGTSRLNEDAFSGRIDYKYDDTLSFYGRYQRNRGTLLSPDGASGRFISAKQNPDNFVFAANKVFGTSIINEVKFGLNRAPTSLSTVVPTVTGLNGIDLKSTSIRLTGSIVSPGVNGGAATGFSEPGGLTRQSSAGNGRSQPVDPTSLSFIDNLSWGKGNHSMKFGVEYRKLNVNFDQLGGTTYSFGSLRDFALNQNLTAAFIGDLSQAGDFRIQTDPITTISRPNSGASRGSQYYLIGYGQDEWRVRPNMVLSYGLRYEYYSVNREKDNRAVLFDAASGKLLSSDTPFYQSKKNNIAPRFGFTWTPEKLGGKTVFRLGGGLYFGPGQYEDLIQPIESNVFRSTSAVPTGLSATTGAAVSNTGVVQSRFTPRAYDVNGYAVPEKVGQYGFSVQQELPGNTVLTVAYVGSQGRNLFLRSITNRILSGTAIISPGAAIPTGVGIVNTCSVPVVAGACSGTITSVRTIREFDVVGKSFDSVTGTVIANPAGVLTPFGEIDYKTSGGRDNYNALQILVNRRFTQGLTINSQYQFGKSKGNTQGSNEAQTAQNPFSFAEEFGNNTFDITHSGNITALYELPFGKLQKYKLSGVKDQLLGGWQVGATFNGRSGTPLDIRITRPDVVAVCQSASCTLGTSTVSQGFVISLPTGALPSGFVATINTPGGNASRNTRRPNLVPGVNPFLTIGGSNGLRFLNPAAFSTPEPGTYGNLKRNALKGPNFYQLDMTFQKKFSFNERINLVFRTEIYNILNKTNFSNPQATLGNFLSGAATSLQPNTPYSTSTNAGQFGVINGTVGRTIGLGTNRQIQFALRLGF
jgi:Carboxypeptidase regulatory-like domain